MNIQDSSIGLRNYKDCGIEEKTQIPNSKSEMPQPH